MSDPISYEQCLAECSKDTGWKGIGDVEKISFCATLSNPATPIEGIQLIHDVAMDRPLPNALRLADAELARRRAPAPTDSGPGTGTPDPIVLGKEPATADKCTLPGNTAPSAADCCPGTEYRGGKCMLPNSLEGEPCKPGVVECSTGLVCQNNRCSKPVAGDNPSPSGTSSALKWSLGLGGALTLIGLGAAVWGIAVAKKGGPDARTSNPATRKRWRSLSKRR